jgi:hypothetical protein
MKCITFYWCELRIQLTTCPSIEFYITPAEPISNHTCNWPVPFADFLLIYPQVAIDALDCLNLISDDNPRHRDDCPAPASALLALVAAVGAGVRHLSREVRTRTTVRLIPAQSLILERADLYTNRFWLQTKDRQSI